MTTMLGASELRDALVAALDALRAERGALDALNVFPVPDGDTGANLVLTFEAVVDALAAAGHGELAIAHAIRSGALMGARGNSGVIFSQILRAWADTVETGPAAPGDIARAFKRAVELAYEAVLDPAEGTILSVLRAASDAAQAGGPTAGERFAVAARAAIEAVERTPQQMELLARAGVVDAGGAGLAIVLGAIATSLGVPVEVAFDAPRDALPATACGDPPSFAYEVMYSLDAPDDRIPALRALLGTIGDSVAVVGGEGSWRVHVHTDDPDRATSFGDGLGTTDGVTVTAFADQLPPGMRGVQLEQAARRAALVVVVDGEGNRRMLSELGAHVVARALDLPAAIGGARSSHAIVVPTTGGGYEAALSLADALSVTLHVFRPVEPAVVISLAALHGDARAVEDSIADMEEFLARARTGSAATREDLFELVGASAPGAELVTIVAGAGVDTRGLAAELEALIPGVPVEVHAGGQQEPLFSVAAE